MKRFLPLFLLLLISAISQKAQAQCTITDLVVENERNVSEVGGSCETTVDVSFTILNNNGNRHIFIHVWLAGSYPNYFQCVNGNNTVTRPPLAADLADAFATIAINNEGATPTLATTYAPDPLVPIATVASIAREILPDGSARITLTGVELTLPVPCGEPFAVEADVWSSQTPEAQVVQCVSCSVAYSSLIVTGFVNCVTLQYSAVIESNSTTTFDGNYRVFVDINRNGVLDNDDARIVNTQQLDVPALGRVTINGTVEAQYAGFDLIVDIRETSTSQGNITFQEILPTTECAALPVQFSLFTATRQGGNVWLNWETAMEENNKGFYVQRNTGNGWIDLTFINSQAKNGNSSSVIKYSYTDVNNFSGATQYRLQQIDMNGASKFSQIRSVKGDGQISKTIIFPNPSSNGSFNIAFDNATAIKNVYISDISGRMLQQWKSVSQNLQVNNLKPGVYTLRIVDVQTGHQITEKVIINKQ